MCLGIGYAFVSQELSINGNAQTVTDEKLAENLNVYFNSFDNKSTSLLSANDQQH